MLALGKDADLTVLEGVPGVAFNHGGLANSAIQSTYAAMWPPLGLGVAAITIANGGDNIGAYTPVFATISSGAAVNTVTVFAARDGMVHGRMATGSHHRVTEVLRRWGHWVVPTVYILIGITSSRRLVS